MNVVNILVLSIGLSSTLFLRTPLFTASNGFFWCYGLALLPFIIQVFAYKLINSKTDRLKVITIEKSYWACFLSVLFLLGKYVILLSALTLVGVFFEQAISRKSDLYNLNWQSVNNFFTIRSAKFFRRILRGSFIYLKTKKSSLVRLYCIHVIILCISFMINYQISNFFTLVDSELNKLLTNFVISLSVAFSGYFLSSSITRKNPKNNTLIPFDFPDSLLNWWLQFAILFLCPAFIIYVYFPDFFKAILNCQVIGISILKIFKLMIILLTPAIFISFLRADCKQKLPTLHSELKKSNLVLVNRLITIKYFTYFIALYSVVLYLTGYMKIFHNFNISQLQPLIYVGYAGYCFFCFFMPSGTQ